MARKLVGVLVGLVALGLAGTAEATLIKRYTYTGNNFNSFSGPPSFDSNDFVSGFFEIDCGLAGGAGDCSSLTDFDAFGANAITKFQFGAGSLVIQEFPINPSVIFRLTTLPDMSLVNWDINISDAMFFDPLVTTQDNSFSVVDAAISSGGAGIIQNSPGTWQVTTVAEPATLGLFAFGLVGLGFAARRRPVV